MKPIFRIGLVTCAAALVLWPSLLLGQEEKPAISVKTKYLEIDVSIEKALHAYPQLYAALLIDAKEYAAGNQKEAQASWKSDPHLFRSHPWTFDRSYRLRVVAPPFVSVLVDSGEYTGGAHPNSLLDTLLWDSRSNKRVEAETLFRETAEGGPTATALAKLVRDAIIAEKKKREIFVEDDPAKDMWLQSIKPDLSTLGRPSLAPSTVAGRASGMTFHFSPYGIGAYAEGSYTAFVPFAAIEAYLTDEAKKIFAGERPKSDEDE